MKKIFAFILALSSILQVRSQIIEGDSLIWENPSKSMTEIMNELFEPFGNDTHLVKGGVLANKSAILITLDSLSKEGFSFERNDLIGIYNEWFNAHVHSQPSINFRVKDSLINDADSFDESSILLLLFAGYFNKFRTDAWSNNYVSLQNFKFYPETTDPNLIFDKDTLFFASPNINKISNNISVDILWNSITIIGNLIPDSVFVEVIGNGSGYTKINENEHFTIYNNYEDTTFFYISCFVSGKSLISKCYFIFDNEFLLRAESDEFGNCKSYNTVSSTTITNPANLTAFANEAYTPDNFHPYYFYRIWYDNMFHNVGVYLGCGNDCIRQPIILVEGYDPTNSRHIWGINNEDFQCNQCSNPIPSMQEASLQYLLSPHDLHKRLRNKGYDVIILDFGNGLASLDNLAGLVKVLLQTIKSVTKQEDSSNLWCAGNTEIAIMGPSQAGLIVRQALTEMEDANEEHNVRLFYSFDAPHQGANIPLSLQYGIDFMLDNMPFADVLLQLINKSPRTVLNATPTKQLLKYYYNDNLTNGTIGITLNNAPEFTNYFNHINQLNNGWGYPRKCRNVAISNGSGISEQQELISPLNQLFHFGINTSLLYNIGMRGYALPAATEQFFEIFNGISLRSPFVSHLTLPFNIINKRIVKVNGELPLDNCPGGNGDFIYLMETNFPKLLHNIVFINAVSYRRPNFISTISGLDLRNTADVYYNVKLGLNQYFITDNEAFRLPETITKFDGIYVENANMPHVICGITQGIADFVMDELMPDHYYLQNRTVEKHLDVYAKNHVSAGYDVTNRIAQGDFVVQGEGHVNITAGISVTVDNGTHFVPTQVGNIHIYIEQRPDCGEMRLGNTNNDNSNPNPTEVTRINSTRGNNNSDKSNDKEAFLIYPNPAENILNIEINSLKDSRNILPVYISNLMGQQKNIKTEQSKDEMGNFKAQCDISNLSAGIYIIIVESEGKRYSGRFVKN